MFSQTKYPLLCLIQKTPRENKKGFWNLPTRKKLPLQYYKKIQKEAPICKYQDTVLNLRKPLPECASNEAADRSPQSPQASMQRRQPR